MARVRKVTRTILSTEAEVLTLNTQTKEVGSVLVSVGGTFDREDEKQQKALDKAVRKAFASMNLGAEVVMASITDVHVSTKKYSMLESQFVAMAECEVVEGEVTEDDDEEEE